MLNRIIRRRHLPALAGTVLVVAVIGAGTATAASLVTSKDVKDGTLRSVDVKDGSLRVKDLTDEAVDTLQKGGATGAKGDKGDKGADATYAGPNWSVVDRNVIGNGDSYLRSGPDGAPLGQGSLGIRTGGAGDKAAFGNQVDFAGMPAADLTHVGFSVFTTGENNAAPADNVPSISFEINPDAAGKTYASLLYTPPAGPDNEWTTYDATSEGFWGLTGSGFNSPATQANCGIDGPRCTFDQVMDVLGPNASILTVQITKGRDYAFSGAVDALRINNQVFDFEPFGVYTRTP
jgi:hypothetical protein